MVQAKIMDLSEFVSSGPDNIALEAKIMDLSGGAYDKLDLVNSGHIL
jgi:hypothetical protein